MSLISAMVCSLTSSFDISSSPTSAVHNAKCLFIDILVVRQLQHAIPLDFSLVAIIIMSSKSMGVDNFWKVGS